MAAELPGREGEDGVDGRGRVGVVGQFDRGLDLLAPLVVGHTEHGHIDHRGVLEECLLDLGGVDVDPTADDHVGGAVGEVNPPVGVDAPHVAQ